MRPKTAGLDEVRKTRG